jgi:hypothetical protein
LPQQREIQYQPLHIDSPKFTAPYLFDARLTLTSVKPIGGGLFTPKLTTNGQS